MNQKHEAVIVGSGPLGKAVARALSRRGRPYRLLSRSGAAPGAQAVDVSDPSSAAAAFEGAGTVFHCAQPPYGRWAGAADRLTAGIVAGAESAAADLVYGDNLYLYGRADGPLTEAAPARATGPNGRLRGRLAGAVLQAHARGRIRTVIGRSSDFFGPHVRNSKFGAGVFGRALAGRPAQVLGDPDAPHTVTFIDDFGEALVVLSEQQGSWGRAWHVPNAPPVSARRFVELTFEALGREPRLSCAPSWAIRLMGRFDPVMAAVGETLHQSERPWVIDSTAFSSKFGTPPTPLEVAILKTVEWWSLETVTPE